MLARLGARVAPYTLTFLRVVVGIVFLVHGLQKFQSLGGTAGFFGMLGVPAPQVMAPVVAVVEGIGGALLIAGFLSRYVNLLQAAVMVGAIFLVKSGIGLIGPMDQPGVGYELDLTLLAASLVLFAFGPGALAVDRLLFPSEREAALVPVAGD